MKKTAIYILLAALGGLLSAADARTGAEREVLGAIAELEARANGGAEQEAGESEAPGGEPREKREAELGKLMYLDSLLRMEPEALAKKREAIEYIERMSPEDKARLRERIKKLKQMHPELRKEFYKRMHGAPASHRRQMRDYWMSLSAEEREQLKAMSHQERMEHMEGVLRKQGIECPPPPGECAPEADGDPGPPPHRPRDGMRPGPRRPRGMGPRGGMRPGAGMERGRVLPPEGMEPTPPEGMEPTPEEGMEPPPEEGMEPTPEEGMEPPPEEGMEPTPEGDRVPGDGER